MLYDLIMAMRRQGEQCGNQPERCHRQSGRLTVVADSSGQAMMAGCKEERTMKPITVAWREYWNMFYGTIEWIAYQG